MEQVSNNFLSTKRYAIVTGANKGIGFEICKQLASQGVWVVLTARDEKRGLEAVGKLKESGLTDHFVFHQLDVVDPSSIASVADFIKTKFGRLDILINNAGIGGAILDADAFARAFELSGGDWTVVRDMLEWRMAMWACWSTPMGCWKSWDFQEINLASF